MLQKLHIQNYAIIDNISIAFPVNLSIITGETGAGKSILMGALGLILGERADSSIFHDKGKKCFVEGVFNIEGKAEVQAFLQSGDYDQGAELILRREVAANGKSRAFINDTPVTLAQLGQLSGLLVDLHQQFDTLALGETNFQREVIDALAANAALLGEYRNVYHHLQAVNKELHQLRQQKAQFLAAFDYNNFLFTELEEAGFKENEIEDIEAELKLLNNSEGIKAALGKASFELNAGEAPVVQRLKALLGQLQSYAGHFAALKELTDRLQSVHIELQDIAGEVDHINDQVNYDPRRIEQLNDRMSEGYKLLKKHGLQTTNQLLEIKAQLKEQLAAVLNIDDTIAEKEKAAAQMETRALDLAKKISGKRQKQARPLEANVNQLLAQVGMPNARLRVDIQPLPSPQEYGIDEIEFLFDANKSNQFAPIRKVASGGELSRLMLCIKSLVAQSIDLPTMIFDEIDTGISGEAARQVGIILKELSQKRQIICITHQPQIAGKADAHFYVYKQVVNDVVKTNIRLLTQEERITTIARMLSGEKPTAAAMENAREMLMN